MRFLSGLKGLTFAAWIMSASLGHAQSAQAPVEGAVITMPLAPPLGKTLRFRLTIQKFRDGMPQSPRPMTWVEEMRYEKTDEGFTLYWRMDGASLPPEMRSPMLAAMVKPYIGQPIAFDLDANGMMLRIHDWPRAHAAIKANIESMRSLLKALPSGKSRSGDIDRMVDTYSAQMDQLSAEQAPDLILANIGALFSWSNISMKIGEVRNATVEVPVAILNTTVKGNASVKLVTADAESATLLDREWVDSVEFSRIIDSAASLIGKKSVGPPPKEPLASSINIVIDRPTGLVARFEAVSREGEKGPLVQKKIISWVR